MPLEDLGSPSEQPSNPPVVSVAGSSQPGSASASDPSSIPSLPGQVVPYFTAEQLGISPYGLYLIDTRYETDRGLVGCPVADGGDTVDIIAVHDGISHKIVKWTCERIGEKPILPHWDTGNDNERCKKNEVITHSTIRTPDGRKIWKFSGLYVYILKKRVSDSQKHYCGAPPFDTSPAALQYIDGSLFSKEILKAAG